MSGQPPYPQVPAAGPAPGLPAPAAPTSSAPKVFGILSIIFASIMLLFSLPASCMSLFGPAMGGLGQMMPPGEPGAEVVQQMMEHMGTVYTAAGIQGLMMLLMSALLLAVGIGQVRYRRWAADWSVYWAIGGFVVIGLSIAINVLMIAPAYEAVFASIADVAPDDPAAQIPAGLGSMMGSMVGSMGSVGQIIFLGPYPLLLLIFFKKPDVQASMTT